jgi:predicted glycoside hydrolase/deacetylase ChbG (UPF0249 family)
MGRSRVADEKALALMERGLVTSATLVASGEALEEFVRDSAPFPQCSFGVHLFLEEFPLLTRSQPLLDYRESGWAFVPPAAPEPAGLKHLKQACYREWMAQIARVRSLGVAVTHMDSHHYVHTLPLLFTVLKRVQLEAGIRKVRISHNCYDPPTSWQTLQKKRLFNAALRWLVPTRTTAHFTFFGSFHALMLRHALPRLSSIELMVHPGAAHYMLPDVAPFYEQEIQDLCSDWRQRLAREHTLISYYQL